jgi:hypothetical protein
MHAANYWCNVPPKRLLIFSFISLKTECSEETDVSRRMYTLLSRV